MKPRTAYCSFCRKDYRDVGPLVEGPGDVYICGECIELCQTIIEQEKRRRGVAQPGSPAPEAVREKLDQLAGGQEEAKRALYLGACGQQNGAGRVLLIGSSPSSKILLARALAHVLGAPFAAGDSSELVRTKSGAEEVLPLLYKLLLASDFDVESAQRGVLYVEGLERKEAQETLLQLWQAKVTCPVPQFQLTLRGILFVCSGTFAGLDEAIARLGLHPEQPVTGEALVCVGARPQWSERLTAIARVQPLGEEDLSRLLPWVDFSRVEGGRP